MLDIKFIRENADQIRQAAVRKKLSCDVDRLLEVDIQRRSVQQDKDHLLHQQKEIGQQIAMYRSLKITEEMTAGQIVSKLDALFRKSSSIKDQLQNLGSREKMIQTDFDALMLTVPQVATAEVPDGQDDTDNIEIRRVGEPRRFDFEPKDHVALGLALDILDLEGGVKLAGPRNYLLKGDGALLHRAVLRLAFDMMVERGFVPMTVPVLVHNDAMRGTGYYPGGEDQAYRCERDALSLVGTAEVPLTSYHGNEILSEADLPLKYVAQSPCFRREAGAAGKDTHGLYRVHYFDKVEQVILCRNDEDVSIEHHREILANAEAVMQALGLPYRVVNVCSGDLGQGQVQKFDIETWMPSRKGYGETHSASRFHDFQARRLNMRYRGHDRKVLYCHTLNNTVIASPRILIPILELNQNADGSITIPEALRTAMSGRERIEAGT